MAEEKRIKSRISQKNIYINSEEQNTNPKVKNRISQKVHTVSGLGYYAGKAGLGALSVVEGAVDIVTGGIADLFGNDDYADYVFQYDTWVNDLNMKLDEGYKPKKVGEFFGNVASGLGQSATFLIPYVGQILFFAGIWGNAVSSASQKTGEVGGREYLYGAGSAVVEWGLERFISGSGQTLETLGKQTVKNVGSKVVKSFGKEAAKTTTAKMVAAQFVSSAAGEAVEEFLGSVWDPIWQRWSGVDDEAKVDWGDAWYSALLGLVSGSIMGGVSTGVQTAYEGKRGAALNQDKKKRDVLLKQARYLVDNAEAQGLTSGSDTVAGHLAELRGGLTSYQNAKDKNSAGAIIALGKIERTLVSTELNVITEARANYVASLSEAERDNLAEWANAYFKEAGVEITAKDLTDTDHLITRTIATMDWVGKVVDSTLGKNRVLNTEIAEAMARQTMSEKQLADEKKKATARKESDRIMTAAKETAVSLDTAEWKGENASYFYEAGGERAYLAIEKNDDGTYQAYIFDSKDFQPINSLTAEQVTSLVDGTKNKLAKATKGKNADEKNKRSDGEVTPTEDTENAESAEKTGESGTKLSLGEEQTSPRKKITRNMSEQERYEILKNRTITLSAKADMRKLEQVEADLKNSIDETLNAKYGEKKALLKKIGEEFGVFKKYTNTDIELDFNFSKGNLKESVSKQTRNYINFAKMLTCFNSVIENAVGVEVHNRNESGYKVNEDLQDVYVLISAFEDGNTVYPVKLEIKEFKNQENTLHVAITLDGIKKEEVVTAQSATNGVTTDTAHSSVISIAQLFKKINPSEENFLKYVPKQFLANEGNDKNSSTKASLGADPTVLEEGEAKSESEYVEKEFKATPDEVKRASKMVKGFKFLPAKQREAIIEMMRTAGNVDKLTVSSIAHFMAAREGLNVRFMKNHVAEGSFDVLKKSGERLILLDPKYNNGKHYRADILAHELYHDIIAESNADAGKALNEMIHESVSPALRREIADRYTKHFNGKSISEYLAEKNEKWTEKNVKKYFKEYTKISYDGMMEEVAAGVMGKIVGQRTFIRQLRAKGLLARTFDHIRNICGAIANRAMTAGGDSSPGFTIAFRDALQFKTLYSQALIATNTTLTPALVSELKDALQSVAELDEERARTKLSLGGDGDYTEYNKPITVNDIAVLRTIDRKSINAFASSDIKATQKWAHKFYKELGTKSPFFRAWFGEWRANQKNDYVTVANIPEYTDSNEARKQQRGTVTNNDTKWNIRISRDGETNTISHAGTERLSEYGLAGIQELVQNAVLLDSELHEHHKNNAVNDYIAFDHKLYALGKSENGTIGLYRITVEEYFQSKTEPNNKRFHNLKYVKKVADLSGGRTFGTTRSGGSTNGKSTTDYSIAELLDFVKTYDAEFTSAPEVNPALLNEDGTPKVVYHGTKAGDFTVFDKDRIGSGATLFASQGKGFYFTENKDVASGYAKSGKVVNVYLKMNNALVFTDKNNNTVNNLIKGFAKQHGRDFNINEYSNYVDFEKRTGSVLSSVVKGDGEAFTAFLREKGYDGIIYTSYNYDTNKADKTYVVFDSEQIKSATNNIGTFDKINPDTRYSLPMYPTLPDAAEVEVELNERDWDFDWSDEALRKNIKTVRAYIEKHYPYASISIEIDNGSRQILVTNVARYVDFEEMKIDGELHDFLASLGVKEEQIGQHLSLATVSEKKAVAKNIRNMEKTPRPRVYYKNQIAEATEGILSQIITPMAGGDAKMLGKDKKKLVTWLLRRMNTAKTAEERKKIARIVAEAFIARTVYADMDVNAEYETMLVDGTIETFEEIKSYLGKIRADSVEADVISTYDKGKGNAVLRRWLTNDNGISIHDAIAELQDQGILSDTDAKNEADMLIALNEEYERLKGLTELRREFLPLANIDKARLDEIQKNIEDIMLGFFKTGGKETKYGQLLRRYKALLSERDAKNQKELEELEANLSERFTKRIDKMREEADRQIAKTKEFYDRRLTESQYAYRYAKKLTRIIADTRNLRDYVNRDYMPAEFMENPQVKGIAKAFMKAVTRTNVKVAEAKEAARMMLEWADNVKKLDETFIGGLGTGTLSQEEYNALGKVASSTAEISFEMEELEAFHTVLQAAIRNYRSYDMLWDGERYVQIGEKAREAVEQQLRAKEESERDGWFAKMSRTIRKIGLQFLDPLSVAAAIDGYDYDGVFQDMLSKLAYAEAEKNKMMGELRAPFEEFLKNHKKYEDRLASEVIELTPEIKITVGQAITLSEMYKRDQAKTALAISRIAFNMDDGTVRKLEGYGTTPFLSTPNGKKIEIGIAKELRRVYYNNRANALATLHEYGYDTSLREGAEAFEQFERDLAVAESEAMNLVRQFGDQRKQIIEDIAKQFTDEDREFIKLVSDFFQTTSKEAKKSADLRNLGYTNVIEGYYFPIKRRSADMAKNIADGSFFSDFITSANISFNHSTMQGAKASIDIFNVWNILTEHIEGLALWEHLYLPVQNINKIFNKNVATQTGPVTVKNILSERTDGDWGKWLADLLLDVQGARRKETKTVFDSFINWMRGKYAVYQLGLNPQTVVKQTLSWAAASQYISPASIAKGLLHPRLNHEHLNRVSAVAAERMDDATVIRAMSNTEKFSKAAEKTMWGITKMDRFVNEALFAMCQEEVAARNPAMPIGSEENLIEAGKLVSEVILKVQDSSDVMTKSQAARSSSELLKAFTMFQSAGIKMFSRIFENVGFMARYRTLSKADQAKYGAQYKQAQKQLAKSVGALSSVAVLTALIVQLFKWIYNKDREDKNGNEITAIEDFATDAATEIVGVVPIIGDIVDYYVNGYEVSNFFSDTFNDTLKAVGQVVSIGARAVGGDAIEDWEVGSMLRKVSRAAGSLTGIPVRNVENTLSGLVRRVASEAGYSYDTLFYDPNYTEDVKKALNKGDTEMAAHIVELMMKRKKTGAKTYSAETINTIVELRNMGYENVFPKTVKIDEMDRKTYKKFISVYGKADDAVNKLVTSKEFKAFTDLGTEEASPQAMAITTLYNAYFDLAEHDVLGEELTRGAAYVSVTDAHNLMLVKAYDKAIKLETVEVKGSRKAMLKAYMKELGMEQTAQAYAAYSCGFRTDGVKNIILADLKGRKDENELLIALGLKEAEEKEDAA